MPSASALPVAPPFPLASKGGTSNNGAAGFGAGHMPGPGAVLARASSSCAAQPGEQHDTVCSHARECLCRPAYVTICMLRIVIGAAGTVHLGALTVNVSKQH